MGNIILSISDNLNATIFCTDFIKLCPLYTIFSRDFNIHDKDMQHRELETCIGCLKDCANICLWINALYTVRCSKTPYELGNHFVKHTNGNCSIH